MYYDQPPDLAREFLTTYLRERLGKSILQVPRARRRGRDSARAFQSTCCSTG